MITVLLRERRTYHICLTPKLWLPGSVSGSAQQISGKHGFKQRRGLYFFGLLYSDFPYCSPLARIVSLFLYHAQAKILYVSLTCDRRKSSVQCVILGQVNCSENIFPSVLRILCLDRFPFSCLCVFVSYM